MVLFTRSKQAGVQAFVLNLVNNHCPELSKRLDNRRDETRVPLSVATLVIPVKGNTPQPERYFATVTKEFSTTGVSIVLHEPRSLDDLILAFRRDAEIVYLRGKARHLSPMGAGIFQLGVELTATIHPSELPELEDLVL